MTLLPEHFLVGATLDAHTLEGGDFNSDWWRWEQRPERIRDGTTSEIAAGHWKRYPEDLGLARKMGHSAVCISLSWPRIHVGPGVFDEDALRHYRDVFTRAVANGLTPLCVLHQVTLPAWLVDRGGWTCSEATDAFAGYATVVADTLGDVCRHWIPVYEPEFWLTMVFRECRWPAPKADARQGYRLALAQMAAAHWRASEIMHAKHADALVGLSIRGLVVEPHDLESAWDVRAAEREQRRLHLRLLEAIDADSRARQPCYDFVALNYAGKLQVRFAPLRRQNEFVLPVDGDGGAAPLESARVSPGGLEEVLSQFAGFHLPILLLGLGVATPDDAVRCRFLRDHIEVMMRCMGTMPELDLRGFLYRSLLDGFEWAHGSTQRYGLVHVQQPGLARTPNPSAWFLKDIIDHRHIRPGVLGRFCGEDYSR